MSKIEIRSADKEQLEQISHKLRGRKKLNSCDC